MRRIIVSCVLTLLTAALSTLGAQESQLPAEIGQTQPAAQPSPNLSESQPDALLLYRRGRDLEAAGKIAEAQEKYKAAITVCDAELLASPRRIEAYVVKCWSLFRLDRHSEVINVGQAALKIQFDARVAEVMGESYYHLGQMETSLKYLRRYIDAVGERGDRYSTAYFYMAEAYLRLKKYEHADIAYSTALKLEPTMPRWWFRLGSVCELLSEWRRAYDAYSRAVALNPSFQEAAEAQARVKPKAGL